MSARIPTYLDRYPAKMVSRLAHRIVTRYAASANRVLDPFCGSGAILQAAQASGLDVSGLDLNPAAALFGSVKLRGFNVGSVSETFGRIATLTHSEKYRIPIAWPNKYYWFTPAVIDRFEHLRGAISTLRVNGANERAAILLALFLTVRMCSRADPRSPKPFISKRARLEKMGRFLDPLRQMSSLLAELSKQYGEGPPLAGKGVFLATRDFAISTPIPRSLLGHSHAITSPPYINAQDYYRNFKIELFVLEGLLPFKVPDLKCRFIGTERGVLLTDAQRQSVKGIAETLPALRRIEKKSKRSGDIVRRYIVDMTTALSNVTQCLRPEGVLVLVCGDNLIAGEQLKTWALLERVATSLGFHKFDHFRDPIRDRLLAPKRLGHKGLIKKEVVMAFRLRNASPR